MSKRKRRREILDLAGRRRSMKLERTKMKPSLQAQISEVERELALRKNVYAQRVAARKMKQAEADLHMTIMGAVLTTLKWLRDNEAKIRTTIGDST